MVMDQCTSDGAVTPTVGFSAPETPIWLEVVLVSPARHSNGNVTLTVFTTTVIVPADTSTALLRHLATEKERP